ncbi:ATP-binding protein [uncultured Prevotella sp.]|uniref:AAA family ATPase n=1 Tax=uncultured Prevotella sp. TaxID=159272 RepID=UPI0025CCB347|nr:ATP-binding protein [uncultured Prevotella sp.]
MYISRIKLYNWKNFRDCEVSLAERCFVIGANATGKSNFLDVLRFLRDIVKQGGGLQFAVTVRGGLKKIRCLAARQRTEVCVEVDISENGKNDPKWKYSLELVNTGGGIQNVTALVNREEVYNYYTEETILLRDNSFKDDDAETKKYTHLEQPTANARFREIKDVFQTTEYLNVIPQFVRDADSIMLSSGMEDYYGRNFMRRLALLNEKTRNKYLKIINEVLLTAVPQLENLSFVKDEKGVPHVEAKYHHWRARGSKQNEQMFSDGTIRLIGFLFAMLDGNGIILLEEPETNLHTAIVAAIPEFVAKVQRNKKRQVIITTHSYEILSNKGIRAEELVILRPSPEGTIAENALEDKAVSAMLEAGLSAADAAMAETRADNIDDIGNVEL